MVIRIIRIAALLTALGALVAYLLIAMAGAANAATVTVGAGDRVNDTMNIAGLNLPGGVCTITAVGYDQRGQAVGLMPGHCAARGHVVRKEEWTPIGVVIGSTSNINVVGQVNAIDVAIIKFYPHVRIRPSGKTVAAPTPGVSVTKVGNGLWSPRVADAAVTHVYNLDARIRLLASPGDSGSPVTDANGQLVGMISRGMWDRTSPDTVMMRVDKALSYAQRNFGVTMQVA